MNDFVKNMKLNGSQKQSIYNAVMETFRPIVINGLKTGHLNEMSDDLLNRAIIAAVDKGDFERAKKFSDYKKDPERISRDKKNREAD